jgi:3-phosphoshikimate 1-carboxyvinyltransferase
MDFLVEAGPLRGRVEIPGSKSHTIRAVAIAALAAGESQIEQPLDSADTRAAWRAYSAFGAEISEVGTCWRVQGRGGVLQTPDNVIDVANSGTTMRIALGSAALLPDQSYTVLTGDHQVRRRPCGPLGQALTDLGAWAASTRANGCPPYMVRGGLRGGKARIEAMTSQYITSLLINAPLAPGDTELEVPLLNEKPYVGITLDWLARQGLRVDYAPDYSWFWIPGGQQYQPVRRRIPGDFSSATFFLAAGAMDGNEVLCAGLDMNDTQGDKAVVGYLEQMGAEITMEAAGVRVRGRGLRGCEIDMNATPDALPMMAALACFAEGTTRLVNVPQARMKETDRIAVMRQELSKLGAKITELPDGLVVEHCKLHPGEVEGHDDHRVVMSLAIAATQIPGCTAIHGYEAVNITFPGFAEALRGVGGKARLRGDGHGDHAAAMETLSA